MIEYTGRTYIASVVFIDIVGYSKAPDAREMAMKRLLNGAVGEAVAGIAPEERIILDTGDGGAICFLGDPEDALFVATAVLDAVRRVTGDGAQQLRIGINLGAIKAITDLNGRPNVIGDGINVAQRVMGFADPDEILVSRSYYEVVARLNEGNERFFVNMGTKKDKHVREHQLYAIAPDEIGSLGHRAERPSQPFDEAGTGPNAAPSDTDGGAPDLFPESFLIREERRLAERIGPLARIIVTKAAASARSIDAFYETIAMVIQDKADRAAFLAIVASEGNLTMPGAETPAAGQADDEPARLSDRDVLAAEHHLAGFIGPMASILVRKLTEEALDRHDFYDRLARYITNEKDKQRFLDTVPTGD